VCILLIKRYNFLCCFLAESVMEMLASASGRLMQLNLNLPLVSPESDGIGLDCSYEELARRCKSLEKSNALLHREYNDMVHEKSASLATLRRQLADMVQEELEDSQDPASAPAASLQLELIDLRATVDFLQREIEVAQGALGENEARLSAQNALSSRAASTQFSQDCLLVCVATAAPS
jgi:chromosome segregation ATPase